MRLWSLDPGYLDAKGLVALWREALLAQKILAGGTRGYRHHPQLARFRDHPDPVSAIAFYLQRVYEEAVRRNYAFDRTRIGRPPSRTPAIEVSTGQLSYELAHLSGKLRSRSPDACSRLAEVDQPRPHPLFVVVTGPVAPWERPRKQS